jgi:hypothetical protein
VTSRAAAALFALALPLAGCAAAARETPVERQARLQADCTAAGFTRDTEAFRLCLLLQETDERLAAVERRLGFIEQDTRFAGFPYYHRPFWF